MYEKADAVFCRVCCSVLQSVWQCVAERVAACRSVLRDRRLMPFLAECVCSVLQSVWQCVAEQSVLQRVAVHCETED